MLEVFTEKFCTDPVEEFFGSERALGRDSDNRDMAEFGYNTKTIRVQWHISCTMGNTSGRNDTKNKWNDISSDPVPKRKKSYISDIGTFCPRIIQNLHRPHSM